MTLSLNTWQLRQPLTIGEAMSAAWKTLKEMGVYAAVSVYHPHRHRRERTRSMELTWAVGPHVHVVCWGPLKAKPLDDARKAGWFVKSIREVKHGEDLRRLVGYRRRSRPSWTAAMKLIAFVTFNVIPSSGKSGGPCTRLSCLPASYASGDTD